MKRLNSKSRIGLAGWGDPTIRQSGFILFLRVHSARNLAAVGRKSYCKLYLGNTDVVNGSTQAGVLLQSLLVDDRNQHQIQAQSPTHRVFRTKVIYTDQRSCPEWNDKLELHVLRPDTEILTIRVKNQLMLCCPAIGACAIPLRNIRVGEIAEQWFPLYKEGKAAGQIRLQLLLQSRSPIMTPPPLIAVHKSAMQQELEQRPPQQEEEVARYFQSREREIELKERRRQRAELARKKRKESAYVQAHQQREEPVKVQVYLQKQTKHEDDWRTKENVQQMGRINMGQELQASSDEQKIPFAEDIVTTSTSMRLFDVSTEPKQSFTRFHEDNQRHKQVFEDVEEIELVFGEVVVVQNALPLSDSSSSEEEPKHHRKHQRNERRRQHSRKHSQSMTQDRSRSSQGLLFPSFQENTQRRKTLQDDKVPLASPADFVSSSEETSSTEEEHRRRRRRKEKKAKMKEHRRKRKAKRKARRKFDKNGSLSSSAFSSSSSLSSSSSSSLDEEYIRKTRKHEKIKRRARSGHDNKACNVSQASALPHSSSCGLDRSKYIERSTIMPDESYASPLQPERATAQPSGYIKSLPPQPQQKRSMGGIISTAANVTSILSDVATMATSVQQLTGGGDAGSVAGILGAPFAALDMSQFFGDQNLSM